MKQISYQSRSFLFARRLSVLSLPLTAAQICDLPPGTISDIVNEHNLTVHWTEKHTHRDCALYTGDLSVTVQRHHNAITVIIIRNIVIIPLLLLY